MSQDNRSKKALQAIEDKTTSPHFKHRVNIAASGTLWMTPEGEYKFDFGHYGPQQASLALLAAKDIFEVMIDVLKARMTEAKKKDLPEMEGEVKLYDAFTKQFMDPMIADVLNDVYSIKFAPNNVNVKPKDAK